MRAVVIPCVGGPEVLEIREVAAPTASPGEELVRVEAAGVNFADTLAVRGGYPGTPEPPLIAGREFAGLRFTSGERVMGYAQWGAFAELISAKSALLWKVPAAWTAEAGAAFPVNFFTAYFAFWKAGLLDRPHSARVLIHAVAGGVGTAAVQMGKLLGVEMYGTSSSDAKLDRLRQLGLEHPINYAREDYEHAIQELTHGEGVDVVFEMLGGEHTAKSVRCLREFGRVIVYGAATGRAGQLDPRLLYAKGASVHGLWFTYLSRNSSLMRQAWQQLSTWIEQGHLQPLIGSVLRMEQAAEAYRLLLERKNLGKVVLRI
jgi:NADPH2:quinone reductase